MLVFYPALMLVLESSYVIDSRMRLFATGRMTAQEVQLMVTEKIEAGIEAVSTISLGGSALQVIESYRERVTANARRLG